VSHAGIVKEALINLNDIRMLRTALDGQKS